MYIHRMIKTAKVMNREILFYHIYLIFPKFSSCDSLVGGKHTSTILSNGADIAELAFQESRLLILLNSRSQIVVGIYIGT